MAITLTTKFAEKIDERNAPLTVSVAGTNQNYEWDGASTIKVTSVGTVATKDYNRSTGFGAVASADDLSNTIQTLTITQDKFFRAKLDAMDENESKIKGAEVLARELREVVLPEIEAYRFGVIATSITTNKATQEVVGTASPYTDFLSATEILDNNNVPASTRVAFCNPKYYNSLKLDSAFVKSTDMAQSTILIKGQVGEVDGIPLVKTTATWLKGYDCMIVDKNATVSPIKLQKYEAILNHPDFDGSVFQGRFYYDAFVLDSKKLGLVGINKAVLVPPAK